MVFRANLRHTNQELRAVIGNDYSGVLICDRFKVYDSTLFAGVQQQKCLTHVLRNAEAASEAEQRKRGQSRV